MVGIEWVMFPFYVIIIIKWVQEILLPDEVLVPDDGVSRRCGV